jgi:lysophospholipase L1-like esterase
VDNIGMRGSSGTFFGSINQTSFANMMKELNVEMVIMQFGGNSMPAMKDSSDVRNYARYFQGQLRTLRKLKPDLAIMVIGPSDMSKLKDGIYETYPLLPYCVSQMKKVSLEMNAGFWNLFDAMGGKNSMPAWVEKDLARPDHIHFSIKGASVASQLFYDALMAEYLKFTTK